jgi:hypothetical protein
MYVYLYKTKSQVGVAKLDNYGSNLGFTVDKRLSLDPSLYKKNLKLSIQVDIRL